VAGTPVRLLEGPLAVPLGLATLHLNETIHDGGRIIQRAVWLQSPQGDVIIGEATTGATGAVCGSSTITIVSRTIGFPAEPFAFTGDLGSFVLPEQGHPTPSDQHVFTVAPGRYSVTQSLSPDQALSSPLLAVTCSQDAAVSIDLSSRTITVVVKPGESLTCTFTLTNGASRVGLGAPPPGTVHVIPSFNPIVLSPTPRIDITPSIQPRPVASAAPTITPSTNGGASPSASAPVGKALPLTSGESSGGGFLAIWLFLVLGVLALFFLLLFFAWRRKREREQEPSP
jgi:hypothetical protein